MGVSDLASKLPDGKSLIKILLISLTTMYSIANFILAIMSTVAWGSARRLTKEACVKDQSQLCSGGLILWGLYLFISLAATICHITSSLVVFNACLRPKGSDLNPLYISRAIFSTLFLLVPLLFVGWSTPNVDHVGKVANNGISGAFIIQNTGIVTVKAANATLITAHFNVILGALLACVAAAMDPAADSTAPIPSQV